MLASRTVYLLALLIAVGAFPSACSSPATARVNEPQETPMTPGEGTLVTPEIGPPSKEGPSERQSPSMPAPTSPPFIGKDCGIQVNPTGQVVEIIAEYSYSPGMSSFVATIDVHAPHNDYSVGGNGTLVGGGDPEQLKVTVPSPGNTAGAKIEMDGQLLEVTAVASCMANNSSMVYVDAIDGDDFNLVIHFRQVQFTVPFAQQ